MTRTYTATETSTFTEARARVVMHNVLGDLTLVASAGLISHATAQEWHEELGYAVNHQAVEMFQLQLRKPEGSPLAVNYNVYDDGSVLEDSKAGGLDFHGLPKGTRVRLSLVYRAGAPNIDKVQTYLQSRGWTTGSGLVGGEGARDRAFSKDGFGIVRSKVGDWE